MNVFGALLLQAGFLSESSWVSVGLLASIVTGTVVITMFLMKIRGDLSSVTKEAGKANEAIDRVSASQVELGKQLVALTEKVGVLLNNHVSRTELELWILRLQAANKDLIVPPFTQGREGR